MITPSQSPPRSEPPLTGFFGSWDVLGPLGAVRGQGSDPLTTVVGGWLVGQTPGRVPFSLKTGPVFPQYMYLTLYRSVFTVFLAVLRRSTTYQRCVVYYTEDALIRVDTRVIRA